MPAFVTAAQVRDYMGQDATTGKWSDTVIGSNIRTASYNLQRWTGRQFEPQTATTKRFTTSGRANLPIPDLRTISSIQQNGSDLTADESYWLTPDRMSVDVSTSLTLRVIDSYRGGPWYLSDPLWWDKGLDLPLGGAYSTIPGDLVITGDWGWGTAAATEYPEPLLHATKVLASWYTVRPESVLADVKVTQDGAILSYRGLPQEVQDFVTDWRIGQSAVLV